ncbi:aminotransferase class III [candidate division WOR-1 bacterium RIFOXYB2_FULL_48_7]|uniref:Aminotransferase class III n=1 Tax=candidate division WOR-1 bacterium RIFOXYB2_FULL_48_7 TaxID=1802583 RepID=A0A1F4TVJ8_UNCSA|nr:MAG: aminotransferase class III [candidate division WOR-1 bacterium RIFOXYB2_FULL_48_7]
MGKSQDLYKKAKTIIPGGTQLLSKRPEMFLPEQWPAYYKKAKGITVWDLDGNKYIDMGIMAIGASSLGYANPEVSKAVKIAINQGCISSLNSYEEVLLAEKLIALHPHMEMVRFARTGGEADSVAVRIARAASGKSKVAVCGYHGWHDWYLATNISDSDNLNDILLPGLSPVGLPIELKGTTLPFHYGKIAELEAIVKEEGDKIGVIVVEVQRGKQADVDFLKKVREIANRIKAVLIFDEVSSSFRLAIGALYKLYNLEPDIVVIGKALGNGHPIAAILGKRNVMEAAQKSFISSSYWTERVGFVAALKTIEQFEKHNVVEYLKDLGQHMDAGLNNIFKDLDLAIENVGMIPVPVLAIHEENPLMIKTVYTQEMLKKGYLATNLTYLSFAHTHQIIDKYLQVAHKVFKEIKRAIMNRTLSDQLDGPVCHSGFQRLT